jgi:NADPH:quinone reductase
MRLTVASCWHANILYAVVPNELMRAIRFHEQGPPDVLTAERVPDPEPGVGEVVIEVAVAGVTFADTMLRRGDAPLPEGVQLPLVPGNEIGGDVVALGPQAHEDLLGKRVIARLGRPGGYAQLAATDSGDLISVPPGLELAKAVAVLVDGRVALGVVREAGSLHGERVLVEAAAGGVGTLLVQLARNEGAASVIAAASGPAKLDLVRRLGADVAVDYTERGWEDRVLEATAGDGVDVVFDSVGGRIGRSALELLRGGGRFVAFGYASGAPLKLTTGDLMRRGVSIVGYGPPRVLRRNDTRELVAEALRQASVGLLEPVVGQTFPLEHAAEAHRAIEKRRTVGKTLLIP